MPEDEESMTKRVVRMERERAENKEYWRYEQHREGVVIVPSYFS